MSIPEMEWTIKDKGFVGETMMAKFRKNEGDRLRRKKIKGMTYGDGSESASSSANASSGPPQLPRNATNFAKLLPLSIKTSQSSPPNLKGQYDNPSVKSITSLTINSSTNPPQLRPLLATTLMSESNNLFKKFDDGIVPPTSSSINGTKDDTINNHDSDTHQLQHNHHHQNNILHHHNTHNAPPLTPVQANTGSSPLEMSPPGSNVSQFFAASPGTFSHIIQSSPQRRSTTNGINDDITPNGGVGDGMDLNLEHATPNSTGSILGSILTPCITTAHTAAISDGDNNVNLGGGGSINILKTAHDYNWAAPIMVPTSMSSLSCLGSASSSSQKNNLINQRSMPQLTSPIRTSPLNLPRRDRSLLLSSSPRLRRSYARSRSPLLRAMRKPFDVISGKTADNTTNGGGSSSGDGGVFDKEKDHTQHKNNETKPQQQHNDHDRGEIAFHRQPHDGGHHFHHHHHRAPHLGIRLSGDGQDHHTTEPITVSFSADTA